MSYEVEETKISKVFELLQIVTAACVMLSLATVCVVFAIKYAGSL